MDTPTDTPENSTDAELTSISNGGSGRQDTIARLLAAWRDDINAEPLNQTVLPKGC